MNNHAVLFIWKFQHLFPTLYLIKLHLGMHLSWNFYAALYQSHISLYEYHISPMSYLIICTSWDLQHSNKIQTTMSMLNTLYHNSKSTNLDFYMTIMKHIQNILNLIFIIKYKKYRYSYFIDLYAPSWSLDPWREY